MVDELPRYASAASAADILCGVEAAGAAIIEDLMSPTDADAIVEEMAPFLARSRTGIDPFGGFQTTRTGALMARSSTCRTLALNPLAVHLSQEFLERWCDRIQLHVTQLIRILPGEGRQPLHRDRLTLTPHLTGIEPQLNFIYALTDFTEENGATVVAPGSHRWLKDREPQPQDLRLATMRKGSAITFTGSVIHGGGDNRTREPRLGAAIDYSLGWVRQEENQYLCCPPELARTFPVELQELLGYTMGSFALGYFSPGAPVKGLPDVLPPELALGRMPNKIIGRQHF